MTACPSCGAENPEHARFCLNCATALVAPIAPSREVRKTVTVLFTDVSGSTALGERLDPESVRLVMSRYFATMQHVLVRHGGTVEKFIGDAIMAVFGIPTLHEDDALRAVRAADEMRIALDQLNQELERERGVTIATRTGITTGEVVAGDPSAGQTLVTGDTVNTAARLEQAAAAGEILLGEPTWHLVRDAVDAERLDPIEAKGKARPVPVYRLVSVTGAEGHVRHPESPLVGREQELRLLALAYERAMADGEPQFFTLLGAAGVGKSRLVAEFLASIAGETTIVKGHCLSYGEGITYWPLREIVHAAAGIDEGMAIEAARARVAATLKGAPDGVLLASRIAATIGLGGESSPQEEIFWTTRRVLEHLARDRPLIVLIEDIHWAEDAFLDLLEYLVDLVADVRILFLCTARPELNERRPGWMGGKPNTVTALLGGLRDDVAESLIGRLPGGDAVPDSVRRRIAARAEGNPLFVEEMVAMLVDEQVLTRHEGRWFADASLEDIPVPASIGALLSARIDALPTDERGVAERASVIGRVFESTALRELAPETPAGQLGRSLLSLVRKDLLRPDRAELTAADAFRFRHILIRDAAYQSLPKLERAALHERFAGWLEAVGGDRRVEYAEIVGHHLVQAARYRAELGESGEPLDALRMRAGRILIAAGTRAVDRGDDAAATGLMRTAAEMVPVSSPEWIDIHAELAEVLTETGHFDEAWGAVEAMRSSPARDLPEKRGIFELAEAWLRWLQEPNEHARSSTIVDAILGDLRSGKDDRRLAAAWRVRGNLAWLVVDDADAIPAWEQALKHDRRGGNVRGIGRDVALLATAYFFGPTPVDEAIAACNKLLEEGRDHPFLAGPVITNLAALNAMGGDFATAHRLKEDARKLLDDLSLSLFAASTAAQSFGMIGILEGNYAEAARELERGLLVLESMGEKNYASTNAAVLAEAHLMLGDRAEASRLEALARAYGAEDDLATQTVALSVQARVHALEGRFGAAIAAAEDAVRRSERVTVQTMFHAASVFALAEVLEAAGHYERSRREAERALAAFDRKGNRPMAGRAKQLIDRLDGRASAVHG